MLLSVKGYVQGIKDKKSIMQPIKITAADAEKMLSDKKFGPIAPKIVKYLKAKKGYMNNQDGRTIIFFEDEIRLYNFDEIMRLTDDLDSVFLKELDPDEIIKNISSLITKFKELFRIDDKDFDYTESTLKHVDSIYPVLEKEGISEGEMFHPLVAFCGEFLIKNVHGVWSQTKNEQGRKIIFIKGENGQEYDPYYCINKILSRRHRPYAFEVAITSQLRPNKLKLANPASNIPLDRIELPDGKKLKDKVKKPKQ
jgi:hypothetical protein